MRVRVAPEPAPSSASPSAAAKPPAASARCWDCLVGELALFEARARSTRSAVYEPPGRRRSPLEGGRHMPPSGSQHTWLGLGVGLGVGQGLGLGSGLGLGLGLGLGVGLVLVEHREDQDDGGDRSWYG